MQKPLIVEPFSQWKLNKIETKNWIEIWRHSWCWKTLGESNLIEFISQFSELTCERHFYFSVDFVVGNSNKLQNWVWKKKIS